MKNENEFNAKFGKELRKFRNLHHYKASDKFTIGVPDFTIWCSGFSVALEMKFVKEWSAGKLIKSHEFTGPQVTFLESVGLTRNLAFGGVYNDTTQELFFILWNVIPKEGNWHSDIFRGCNYPVFKWNDIAGIVRFWEDTYEKSTR